jgi:hypothetical protein
MDPSGAGEKDEDGQGYEEQLAPLVVVMVVHLSYT